VKLIPALLWFAAVAMPIACTHAGAADRGQSEWVHPGGADGRLVYKTTPTGERIMDFSYAGYMGGGVALPEVPVRRTVQPSTAGDDTNAIQAAIDEVAKLPPQNGFRGAVLLAPGTFTCADTIRLNADGVALRGSGSAPGKDRTTIKLAGRPHVAISVRAGDRFSRGRRGDDDRAARQGAHTAITDAYVPSGVTSFNVASANGFAPGDRVEIRKPVTAAWVRFMHMDDLVRDGKPQTWIGTGEPLTTERVVAAVSGNTITVDVPLSDSIDTKFLDPSHPAELVKLAGKPRGRVVQCGVESLHIECPPQAINHTESHFSAIRMSGEDCWIRDVVCDETMNSVGISGRRITLQRVTINRKAMHQGSSKPAEFAPNGTQVLMDRCSVTGDNIWFAATGAGVAGPVVLLNCTFHGTGRAESHQRWSTGMLYDNVVAEAGGLDFRNRGEMGSGHGWTMGWGVAWNCRAKDFVIQQPPGTTNWMIGCVGESSPKPRPFDKSPALALGVVDSAGKPVTPESLYLTQLAERLGPQAMKNIGY
jgi:hypothetical protein